MLPPELKLGSAKTDCFNENDQEERRLDDINVIEERRNQALDRFVNWSNSRRFTPCIMILLARSTAPLLCR